jgi:deoxyribodipyrimidine photo-lyase
MSTALVWFRRDLRVHDHPLLVRALAEHDRVVPCFVVDRRLLHGRFPSAGRAQFLLESLHELRTALRERGGTLAVRVGDPARELAVLAREHDAQRIYAAADVSPFARARDRRVENLVLGPGVFCADLEAIQTSDGRPYTVFSPFHRAWERAGRRTVHHAPGEVPVPSRLRAGEIPTLADLRLDREHEDPLPGGETAGRERLARFLDGAIECYAERHDRLAGGTSMLSPYLHFGNVSAREVEERAARRDGDGPAAFRRQLAWRDFFGALLWHFPANARHAFQRRYDELEWDDDESAFRAWQEGRTGYPLVDAGMRQLRAIGWMHNRARLVAGSFLTKDLHQDWRRGEEHFMRWLLCGDEAQNNGNWQWVASVGADPAPAYRRLFNPTLQQRKFDPDGEYVRRWVPELRGVPDKRLAEPWTMSEAEQAAAGCVIGRDYPAPVVDHAVERRRALERYGAVSGRRVRG